MSSFILIGASAENYAERIFDELSLPVYVLPKFESLSSAVIGHADSLVFNMGNSLLTMRDYYEANKGFFSSINANITLTDEAYGAKYPNDILLNALCVGNTVIGRCDKISTHITKKRNTINVKQGYARCSVLMLGENAAISSDKGLLSALSSLGVDTLEIPFGNIALKGCDYGFIGGASFVYDKHVFFFGNISRHPSYEQISFFLQKHGYSYRSLGKNMLEDCGGALLFS